MNKLNLLWFGFSLHSRLVGSISLLVSVTITHYKSWFKFVFKIPAHPLSRWNMLTQQFKTVVIKEKHYIFFELLHLLNIQTCVRYPVRNILRNVHRCLMRRVKVAHADYCLPEGQLLAFVGEIDVCSVLAWCACGNTSLVFPALKLI